MSPKVKTTTESSNSLQSVLSMNDVTGNYLWLAPLKPNLFPLYIFSALFRPPCFQGLDLIQPTSSLIGQKRSFIRFLPQATEFYGVDLGLGPLGPSSSGMALPILHLYCIGRGTKVTVVVTAFPVYDPLK